MNTMNIFATHNGWRCLPEYCWSKYKIRYVIKINIYWSSIFLEIIIAEINNLTFNNTLSNCFTKQLLQVKK